jgi:hypothetical protein
MEVGSVYPYVDGSNLLAIPAGEFIMGSGDGEGDNPEHGVTLNDYWIYSTKVTNQQYALCVELGHCTSPDLGDNQLYTDTTRANDPVVGVTYNQASDYCNFAQGRLPTEAEWEKAARGPRGSIYPWGNESPTCNLLNFDQCVGGTTNVVDYPEGKSYYGALDMAGNAFEWVADWYGPNYYRNSPQENPLGPDSGTTRSVRSSNFESIASQVEIALRNSEDPEMHRPDLGFRCVVDNPTYFAPFCESPLIFGSATTDASNQDSSPFASCPDLDISQAKYCVRKLPVTNVVFSGPPDAFIDSGDCIPSGDPSLFVCQSPGEVSIRANCQVDGLENLSCPPGFIQQGGSCAADGIPGACLGGIDYDPTRQCCVSQSGQDVTSKIFVCPVGTFYEANQMACLPFSVEQNVVSIVQSIEFTICSAQGKSGEGEGDTGAGGGDSGGGDPCEPFCY